MNCSSIPYYPMHMWTLYFQSRICWISFTGYGGVQKTQGHKLSRWSFICRLGPLETVGFVNISWGIRDTLDMLSPCFALITSLWMHFKMTTAPMGLVQWCHILTVFLQLCYCLLWIWIRSSCLFLIAQILQTPALSCECLPENPGLIYPVNYQLHFILTSTFNKVTFHLGNFTRVLLIMLIHVLF